MLTLIPDDGVEAPYCTLDEYRKRFALALAQEQIWDRRIAMQVEQETLWRLDAESWPRWAAMYALDLDECGRRVTPPAPVYDPTDTCLTTDALAGVIGCAVEFLEAQPGISTKDGAYYREGDSWRFYSKRSDASPALLAAAE